MATVGAVCLIRLRTEEKPGGRTGAAIQSRHLGFATGTIDKIAATNAVGAGRTRSAAPLTKRRERFKHFVAAIVEHVGGPSSGVATADSITDHAIPVFTGADLRAKRAPC